MTTRDPQLTAILQALPTYQRCIVSSHVNGDGDSFGSQLSLARLLRKIGKEAMVINDSDVPKNLQFLPDMELLQRPGETLPEYDALFTVDIPVLHRLGRVAELHDASKPVIVLDHHVPQEPFGTMAYIDTTAAASGEVVLRLYDALDVPLDREAALLIYVTVLMDTGSFRYSSTTPGTHQLAARLMAFGIAPDKIYQQVYEHRSETDLKLQGLALEKLKVTSDGKFAWIVVTQSMLKKAGATLPGSEALIDVPRSLHGTEAVFVARQLASRTWRVSLRSKGRVDVNAVAKQFAGGGHRAASGCTIEGTEASVMSRLEQALRAAL